MALGEHALLPLVSAMRFSASSKNLKKKIGAMCFTHARFSERVIGKMYNDIWIHPLKGIYPKTYIVMVNGEPYDTLFQRSGKWLSRDDMKSIADGYREWFDLKNSD
jgi:hypothetical protein